MGRIGEYLAESLTDSEMKLLWDFIQTGKSTEDVQPLVKLRIVENGPDGQAPHLTHLGRDVLARTSVAPD